MMQSHSTAARPQIKSPPTPPRREQILGIVHHDGWIELYGERHIDARIVMVPAMSTAAGEIAAEQYIETILPDCYRRLYWPGNLRAAAMMRVVHPSDIARRNHELELLRSIDSACEILRGGVTR